MLISILSMAAATGALSERQVLYLIKLRAAALLRPEFEDMATINCKITLLT
jgi:hypothetical protein